MKYPRPTIDPPEIEQLEKMCSEGMAEATDGCIIELDGICQHGHPSWFLFYNLI